MRRCAATWSTRTCSPAPPTVSTGAQAAPFRWRQARWIRPGELVGRGLAAAQEPAQRLEPGGGVVLGRPLIQHAPRGQVVAAWGTGRRSLGQVAERLDDPVGRHVAEAEAAYARGVDQ